MAPSQSTRSSDTQVLLPALQKQQDASKCKRLNSPGPDNREPSGSKWFNRTRVSMVTRLKSVSPEVMDNFKAYVQQCTTTPKGKTLDMHWRHDRSCRNSNQISDRTSIPTQLLFPTRLLSFYSYSFVTMTTEAIPISLATSIAKL